MPDRTYNPPPNRALRATMIIANGGSLLDLVRAQDSGKGDKLAQSMFVTNVAVVMSLTDSLTYLQTAL
jgi:hypothetical protein